MNRFRKLGSLAAVVVAILLTSCAPSPEPEAWVITPIEYDNSMDGDSRSDVIDVTYPMTHIAADSAGGFWTESAGSWLHLDEHATATRRFNLDGEKAFLHVRGISAIDSTTLVVSGYEDGDWNGGLWLFDTTAMTWTPMATDAGVVDDVAAVGDTVFYAEILHDDAGDASFVVRRLEGTGLDPVVSPQLDMKDGNEVKLSVAPDTSIVANTGSQLLAIDTAGAASQLSEFSAATPVSATTTADAVAWATDHRAIDEPWYIDGGSADARNLIDARRLLDSNEFCDPRSIETSHHGVSPPLCNVQAVEWVDSNTLIVSAGTEGGSILARIHLP